MRYFPDCPSDRHRGGGHPPTPATPPCVRVRTRRFELVALTAIDQRRKSKRFEVGVGKPHREGFCPSEVPRAASAATRVRGESRTDPQRQQSSAATAWCFPFDVYPGLGKRLLCRFHHRHRLTLYAWLLHAFVFPIPPRSLPS